MNTDPKFQEIMKTIISGPWIADLGHSFGPEVQDLVTSLTDLRARFVISSAFSWFLTSDEIVAEVRARLQELNSVRNTKAAQCFLTKHPFFFNAIDLAIYRKIVEGQYLAGRQVSCRN